jgi:uncharacterized protein involved in type VI secretion and phage assembly
MTSPWLRAGNAFEIPQPGLFNATYLARVVSVQDPEAIGRVQVRLLNFDGVEGQDGPVWARVAAPFAGDSYGAFMIPNVDDEVLVSFVNADPRMPVVVGSLWNGAARPPEQLPGAAVDRWTLVGRDGTRIAIVEAAPGQAKITFDTPNGVSGELTDQGSKINFQIPGGGAVTIEPSGITINTSAKVTINASTVEVTAGMVTVNAGMSRFSGVVQCDALISNTVVSSVYTPGAGNIW